MNKTGKSEEFKWAAIMFVGIAIAGGLGGACSSWSHAYQNAKAMERGYEQVESDSGKLMWVKKGEE